MCAARPGGVMPARLGSGTGLANTGQVAAAVEEEGHGARRFLSGPFEVGLAMLVTPTCSMRAQGAPDRYAHPVRSLVPLGPFEELVGAGLLDDSKTGLARKRDG